MGTQNPEAALKLAADVGGVKPENVFIHTCFLGGGFDRRSVNDELRQAVKVSRTVGRPVKLDPRGGHPPRPLPAAGRIAVSSGPAG
jgi:isoquinoline 1-oxidoreductase subunit beta